MRLLVVLLFITSLVSCGEQNNFTLKGKINGVDNDKIVLGSNDRLSRKFISLDTVDVHQGEFTFKKINITTGNYVLKLVNAEVTIPVLLENGELSLLADIKDVNRNYLQKIELQGGTNHNLLQAYWEIPENLINEPQFKKSKDLRAKMSQVPYEQFQDVKAEYEEVSKEYYKESWNQQKAFIHKHINKYFVAELFVFIKQPASIQEIKELYSLLPAAHQEHPNVIDVMKDVKIKESIVPGKQAPDFTLKTPDGKVISLSDLQGKYVLIDFWASWCKPCRKAFPHMKELYKKYHSKGFEILGVTNDTNHKLWKKAIEKDEIPWLNVADEFPENGGTARVIGQYGMDYLPSTLLIDKDGIIIAKQLHGHELDEKLKELFVK